MANYLDMTPFELVDMSIKYDKSYLCLDKDRESGNVVILDSDYDLYVTSLMFSWRYPCGECGISVIKIFFATKGNMSSYRIWRITRDGKILKMPGDKSTPISAIAF